MNPTVAGIIRHVLTAAGGYLVAKGIIDEGALVEAVGAIVTIAGLVWSIFQKQGKAS